MEEFVFLLLASMRYRDLSYPTRYRGEQIRQERRVSSRFDWRFWFHWRTMSNLLSVRLRAAVRYFGPWNFERTVLDCLAWAHSFHKAPRASAIWRVRQSLPLIQPQLKATPKQNKSTQPPACNVKSIFHHVRVSRTGGHKWVENALESLKYILLTESVSIVLKNK